MILGFSVIFIYLSDAQVDSTLEAKCGANDDWTRGFPINPMLQTFPQKVATFLSKITNLCPIQLQIRREKWHFLCGPGRNF